MSLLERIIEDETMLGSNPIELMGSLILQGPFLEQVWAVHLMTLGKNVVRRKSTYGVHHDILVEDYDGYEVYECTGQETVTVEKVHYFREMINDLIDRIKRFEEEKKLVRAFFVSMCSEDSWSPEAISTMERLKADMAERGCEVKVIGGFEALKQVLSTGALGLRLSSNRIMLAGPEEYAIRFDPMERVFKISFPKINLSTFRATPFSSLPSHYWELYYHDRVKQAYEKEYAGKGEPITWTYPPYEGLYWRNVEDFMECYRQYLNTHRRTYARIQELAGQKYLYETYRSARRNWYYTIHLFSVSDVVEAGEVKSLRGYADEIATTLKKEVDYLSDESLIVEIHTASEVWTSGAWTEFNKPIAEHLKELISGVYARRGCENLLNLLNSGVLGFRFRRRNEITLYGPGIKSIRRTWKERKFSLDLSEEPI